jgi:radical SAM protein with 4Fe4S-binding SPASM domain
MRIELHDRVQRLLFDAAPAAPLPYRALGGRFFSEILRLPAGRYAARVQIMFSERADGEPIRLAVRTFSGQLMLDQLELAAVPENRDRLDDLYLRFSLDEEQTVEIFGHAGANCATTLLRFITVVSVDGSVAEDDFYFQGYAKPAIKDLTEIIFGTTGVCNASCLHCPTNKEHRRGFPHGYMDFEMFSRIIRDLAEGGYTGWFLFGLFGEPLEDPLLERRLRLIKEMLPRSAISIATNCGVYDPDKHRFVLELADKIAVHVEAVSAEIYNRFMHPLKAERVFPRILSLLSCNHDKKVYITSPIHKGNLAELPNIRDYFISQGADEPQFTQISNRCWEEGPWSELALAPIGGFCAPDYMNAFVVDFDGAVLGCCLDFSKSARLGDLTKQSVAEVLDSPEWGEMFDIHRTKNWSKKAACSRCRSDQPNEIQRIIQPLIAAGDGVQRFPAAAFRLAPGVIRENDGRSRVDTDAAGGIVIFGPYRRLDPGRYRVTHSIEVTQYRARGAALELDILKDCTAKIAVKTVPIARCGALEVDLEFDTDGSVVEFRVARTGVNFVHGGAIVTQL